MEIRTAELSDLDAIARVEAECFPQAEAATREDFEKRLAAYRNHFVAGEGHHDMPQLEELEHAGLVKRGITPPP